MSLPLLDKRCFITKSSIRKGKQKEEFLHKGQCPFIIEEVVEDGEGL